MFEFDPDGDGFSLDHDTAIRLHCNTNLLYFIRKSLQISAKKKEPKAFMNCLKVLDKMPEWTICKNWDHKNHDLELLRLLSVHGSFLYRSQTEVKSILSEAKEHFLTVDPPIEDFDPKVLLQRVEDVCKVCRDDMMIGKVQPKKAIKTSAPHNDSK